MKVTWANIRRSKNIFTRLKKNSTKTKQRVVKCLLGPHPPNTSTSSVAFTCLLRNSHFLCCVTPFSILFFFFLYDTALILPTKLKIDKRQNYFQIVIPHNPMWQLFIGPNTNLPCDGPNLSNFFFFLNFYPLCLG